MRVGERQVALSLVLLHAQLGVSFLAGIALLAVVIPLNSWVARAIGRFTKSLSLARDRRMSLVSRSIRTFLHLKAMYLHRVMERRIMKERSEEFRYLSLRRAADAVCVFLWAATPSETLHPHPRATLCSLSGFQMG